MKKLLVFILALVLFTLPVFANDATLPRLVDEADILTDSEEEILLETLDEISVRQECDVVIVTLTTLGDHSVTAMADDFYDLYGYGYGPGDDGILFLISMTEREYATSTYGFGITAFTDYGQDVMLEKVVPYLSDGEYFEGFMEFASRCDDYLTEAQSGTPYDIDNQRFSFDPSWIIIALVVGVIVAFIYTGTLKAQLNNVKKNNSAANYVRSGSMNLSVSNDMFLYRNVSRTARPKDNGGSSSSRGGSSTRISSSGRSHGGRSGRF